MQNLRGHINSVIIINFIVNLLLLILSLINLLLLLILDLIYNPVE